MNKFFICRPQCENLTSLAIGGGGGLGWPLHKITMETDVQRKTIITGDFPNIYIGNVTPKLALSTFEQFFEQLTLLMVNGPSDFNYEIFLSDM